MHRLLRTFTYAGVPPLVVGGALLWATDALLGTSVSPGFFVAALSGVWLVYLGERLAPAPEDVLNHPGRTRWLAAHRPVLLGLCGACVVIGGVAARTLRLPVLAGGAVLALAGAAYALPVFGRRLKTFPVVKPLLVGAAWATAAVVLPLVEARQPFGADAALLWGARTLVVAANVLLHDWAERAGDRAAGAGTLPTGWGWPRLRGVTALLLAGALVCEALLAARIGPRAVADAGGVLLMALMLRRAPTGGWRESLVLDLIVAWPLVTAFIAAG